MRFVCSRGPTTSRMQASQRSHCSSRAPSCLWGTFRQRSWTWRCAHKMEAHADRGSHQSFCLSTGNRYSFARPVLSAASGTWATALAPVAHRAPSPTKPAAVNARLASSETGAPQEPHTQRLAPLGASNHRRASRFACTVPRPPTRNKKQAHRARSVAPKKAPKPKVPTTSPFAVALQGNGFVALLAKLVSRAWSAELGEPTGC
mmetsp:Transcript_26625/g.76202  ORF Transcript_26625/g.76202 Transcript_26625/m.76202 type:complete len:204 (-) Transcript_26625:303-914(-)